MPCSISPASSTAVSPLASASAPPASFSTPPACASFASKSSASSALAALAFFFFFFNAPRSNSSSAVAGAGSAPPSSAALSASFFLDFFFFLASARSSKDWVASSIATSPFAVVGACVNESSFQLLGRAMRMSRIVHGLAFGGGKESATYVENGSLRFACPLSCRLPMWIYLHCHRSVSRLPRRLQTCAAVVLAVEIPMFGVSCASA